MTYRKRAGLGHRFGGGRPARRRLLKNSHTEPMIIEKRSPIVTSRALAHTRIPAIAHYMKAQVGCYRCWSFYRSLWRCWPFRLGSRTLPIRVAGRFGSAHTR